jgi:cyanophycinase
VVRRLSPCARGIPLALSGRRQPHANHRNPHDRRAERVHLPAKVIFFSSGDQVRITSRLGGTVLCDAIRKLYDSGVTLAGTSAGTSCMSETMLVGGSGEESHKVGAALLMAPGLGLMTNVIIDQHFAERGRIGRLLGAVAQNPRILGVGIDEDTAIIVNEGRFRVFGSGAVYVIDAISESYTNVSEEEPDRTMSIFDVRLHILAANDSFDLATRRPRRADGKDVGLSAQPRNGATTAVPS